MFDNNNVKKYNTKMITSVILSAGRSQRFGSPKALAVIKGKTIIEHLQEKLLQTQSQGIIVVLGADADRIRPFLLNHKRIKVVYNKDYIFGQTSSFKAALDNLRDDSLGALLLPVDCPAVKIQTVDLLINTFINNKIDILIPSFENRKGHPPIFHTDLKTEITALDNSLGLNTLARKHAAKTEILPVSDSGVIKTFNTVKEFEEIEKFI